MNLKRMIMVFLLLTLSLSSLGCQQEETVPVKSKMIEFINNFNTYSSVKFNGSIILVEDNEVILDGGYGYSIFEDQINNTSDTIFPIGSITKSFTATALLQLEEEGKLSTNDNVSNYIKGFNPDFNVTIHHLLTHTSGLPREGKVSFSQGISIKENIDYINNLELMFTPGSDFSYSNAGYILLAAIIEEVANLSYNEYIAKNIFKPLNMTASVGGFDASYLENQAIGYTIKNGKAIKENIYDLSIVTGSGNIYSTTKDLVKYLNSIEKETILTNNSIEKMLTTHWGDNNYGYGYGWEVYIDREYECVAHGGTIGRSGYNSYLINYPKLDLSLILLSNTSSVTSLEVVRDSLLAIYFGEDVVVPKEANKSAIKDIALEEYGGTYFFNDNYSIDVIYENYSLYITADDNNSYKLVPVIENTFQYEGKEWIEANFSFNDDKIILTVKNINTSFQFERIVK